MKYISTRGETPPHSFCEAVEVGLAPDRGLFVPESLPDITGKLSEWKNLSYPQLAAEFLALFAPEISKSEWHELTAKAYGSFGKVDHTDVVPLHQLDGTTYVLEMFRGPTLAFKDFALQLLGLLYKRQVEKSGERLVVLGATSGDTGSAAIHGCAGQEFIKIFILYPKNGVSHLQERQMVCTGASNVFAIPIEGTFDDAQRIVKQVFGDRKFSVEYNLSAINSINIARLLAQCVYYVWAWLRLPMDARHNVEFVIPTGNFGNALAGWMTKQMGLPIGTLRVATNRNKILYDFFTAGVYKEGRVESSFAPSMDIQAASNIERLLYYLNGQKSDFVKTAMNKIKEGLPVAIPPPVDIFRASTLDDDGVIETIRQVHDDYNGYVIDPHTACAFTDMSKDCVSVVLATASPAKFPEQVTKAIGSAPLHPTLEQLKDAVPVRWPLPANADSVKAFIQAHAAIPLSTPTDSTPFRLERTPSREYNGVLAETV